MVKSIDRMHAGSIIMIKAVGPPISLKRLRRTGTSQETNKAALVMCDTITLD